MRQWMTDWAAQESLEAALEATRPWDDDAATAQALSDWFRRYSTPLEPLVLIDVAAELPRFARYDSHDVAKVAFGLARNVVAGRSAYDNGSPFDPIVSSSREPGSGVKPRTARHYRQHHGDGALFAWMHGFQYDLDLAALVAGGRSEAAARRWLERNPGKHAQDAPAARLRRSA